MGARSVSGIAGAMTDFAGRRAELGALVLVQVERSVAAFGAGDVAAKVAIEADDRRVDALCISAEQEILRIRRRWSPQLTDLRTLHAGLIASVALERVGNLAVAIALRARQGHPLRAYPAALAGTLDRMGAGAVDAIAEAIAVFCRPAEVDLDLQKRRRESARATLGRVLGEAGRLDPEGAGWITDASDGVLVARHLERITGNAFEISRRMRWARCGSRIA